MERKIFKTGHSIAIILPAKLLEALGLKLGDAVTVEFDETRSAVLVKAGRKGKQLPLDLKLRKKL